MKVLAAALMALFFFQENHPPVVRIISPSPANKYTAGSTVRYSISVSDKEDGDTKFDEINPNEILLEVRTLNNISDTGKVTSDRKALHAMMSSNCMNCHAFTSKLIGPSFYDISTKKSNVAEMVKHVKDGSTGVWGEIVMPSHPELQNEEITQMVNRIVKYKEKKNVEYFLTKEGTFHLKKPVVVITAGYLDHHKMYGEDKVVLIVQ